MAKDKKSPATTSAAYDYMTPKWGKIGTVLAGTDAMRDAGQSYLPRHEEEGGTAYNERLARATLLNMTAITLDNLTGKPFSEPVKVGADVPAEVKALLDDLDLQGNNLDVFSREWFRTGLGKGLAHVLVEMPRVLPKADGTARTLEDDRLEGVRPYLVQVKPENVLFAYGEVTDGVERLLHVRILEEITEMDEFAETSKVNIRVLTPGHVKIYEKRQVKNQKPTWVVIDEWDTGLTYIPLVTFYAQREGLMTARPPLEDLADLNIRHWQSTSDQISVLTVARFPILAVSGAMSDDKLVVGPNQWLNCPDPAGRFYYVEHGGKAIEAGRMDLLDLEERMAEYGAIFLKKRPGGASATARALDSAETICPLQDMAIRYQSALNQCFKVMADWLGLPTGGTFQVHLAFALSQEDTAKLDGLTNARKMRDISREDYLTELKRYKVLGEDFDIAQNMQRLQDEVITMTGGTKSELDPAAKA